MAYKRLIVLIISLTICYFVGVTWADTAGSPTVVQTGSNVASNTNNTGSPSGLVSNATTLKSIIQTQAAAAAANATKKNCVCDGALVPRLADNGKELEICPECKCKHVARNTTLIKVVVIIVIWIISILVVYMLFLMCLDPLLNKRVKANYQEHTNEDDDATSTSPPAQGSELSSRANVLNRVGHQQNKWKRQVREQRRHIYDRRTMLN